MNPVLVDTSVWIDFFRRGTAAPVLENLAETRRLATCGLVKSEFLPFVRTNPAAVRAYFADMIHLAFTDDDWKDLEEMQRRCITLAGRPCAIPDLIIIYTAKKHRADLFSRDKTMARIAESLDVHLFHAGCA